MQIELNKLAGHLARTAFQVEGVYHYSVEPGRSGVIKTSPYPGFIFPLAGQAEFIFDGVPYIAGAGNVIHGGVNMSLNKRVIGNAKWEYILVLYRIGQPEPDDLALEKTHFELITGQSPRLSELLRKLWRASNQPGSIPAFQRETLFRCVLEEVFICASSQSGGDDQLLFKQAADYIHQYYMDPLTIRALAGLHGVNENRLFYLFNKYAGMGPGDYLMIHRLNKAKELLATGSASILAIARCVGYTDPYHFSRSFKNQFGLPPSQFRKTFRNNA
jgi:AraC-like DNA-binding protein